jgi:tetratricopeptide (TPR) repeat protein
LGYEFGQSQALLDAIGLFRNVLLTVDQTSDSLDWASTQNNLGIALSTLGERESGTEKLEQAVAAYDEALKERARERVPLDWASTQDHLGLALSTLGQRESGTGKLEQAVAAYREALKERTRERVPLDWASTQNGLGNAQRSGSGRAGPRNWSKPSQPIARH